MFVGFLALNRITLGNLVLLSSEFPKNGLKTVGYFNTARIRNDSIPVGFTRQSYRCAPLAVGMCAACNIQHKEMERMN